MVTCVRLAVPTSRPPCLRRRRRRCRCRPWRRWENGVAMGVVEEALDAGVFGCRRSPAPPFGLAVFCCFCSFCFLLVGSQPPTPAGVRRAECQVCRAVSWGLLSPRATNAKSKSALRGVAVVSAREYPTEESLEIAGFGDRRASGDPAPDGPSSTMSRNRSRWRLLLSRDFRAGCRGQVVGTGAR